MLCPNPASKHVTVRAGPGLERVVVRDVLGRSARSFKPGGAIFEMDLTGFRAGLYFIELRYNTGKMVKKLVRR
jgi:hypothetical protein